MSDPTPEEISKFMAEYDAGLHPLSKEDEAALEKHKPIFLEKLRQSIYGGPDEHSFSA